MVSAVNFDNLVAVLAVAAAVPVILAAVPRVPVPGPVLEILAGIVLGPAVLGLVKPDQAVRLVSTIGLAFRPGYPARASRSGSVKAGWIVASAVDGAAVVIEYLPAGLEPGRLGQHRSQRLNGNPT